MTLRIEAFPGGPFETNTYLVADLESGEALVVDAAQGTVEAVRAAAAGRGWRVGRIVITHSHWDHIVDAVAMKEALGSPLLTPAGAEEALANPGSFFGGLDVEIPPVTPDQAIDIEKTATVRDRVAAIVQHEDGVQPHDDAVLLTGIRWALGTT